MSRKRRRIVGVWLVLSSLCLQGSMAIGKQPSPHDVSELLKLTGVTDIGKTMAPLIAEQFVAVLGKADSANAPRMRTVVTDVVASYLSKPGRAAILEDRLIPLYERIFTEREIAKMIEFYRTPVGRKLTRSLPEITRASAQIGGQWAAEMMPGLKAAVLDRLRAEQLLPQ